jgi:predicted component of type VI protein secretion system
MNVQFVIVSPASRKAVHAVRLPVLVGRGDEAKFRVQQDSVSRRHCEFFVKDEAVFVRDLGSTNGTLVNGERITSSVATPVSPGSEIRVGGIVFRVDYESAADPATQPPRGDDTVPMAATDETLEMAAPEPGPEVDVPNAAPETAAPDLGSLGAEPAAEPSGFNFLGGGAAEPPSGGDDKLDDFFKSLT